MKDANLAPIGFDAVRQTVGKVMAKHELPASGDWPALSDQNILEALKALSAEQKIQGKAVYISGGSLYSLGDSGQLEEQKDHPAAQPYMWPIAHDVRPAAQALGSRRCEDCHSPDAPFFFGRVSVDTPVLSRAGASIIMNELIGASRPTYAGVSLFFKWLIIVVMALLILHILGDLFRRFVSKVTATKPGDERKQ
jgi:hypothetical protein